MKKPSSDLLTTAMDVDRNTLPLQQKLKKGVNKGVQLVDAGLKPISRAKQWLAGVVDSIIERNEEQVKANIIENPSYRTTLFKAGRLAIKLGLTGILYTINSYIAAAYVVVQVSKFADRERLKKDVQNEFGAQIKVMNDQIETLSREDTPEANKTRWQLMRQVARMEQIVSNTPKSIFKTNKTIV